MVAFFHAGKERRHLDREYLCIHGHFYQPPRENPWLDFVEYQPSARPYHDWNGRITRECYGPNARARVHGADGRILKLVNNYSYMSFNFGPTLLSWLEKRRPWVYAQILAGDRESISRYGGHGNALAQVYNHIIMPLACRRDKVTQIRWGLADFEHRFGRPAEGMWLAETAVDTETLDLMAAEGVSFTILSPFQARSVRTAGGTEKASWQDVSGGTIDTTRPYRVFLDESGSRFMDVFFYDGTLSKAVAYEKILSSGKDFLSRIEDSFGNGGEGPLLVNIATDGESYGHHFKFGDLALAWLFNEVEEKDGIGLINYGEFLERFSPEWEVELIENSSWSCAHGVERWRADCGCSVSQNPAWNQAWRGPLREGLDRLRGELEAIFEKQGGRLFKDPWQARDDYIEVLLDPSSGKRAAFLERHRAAPLEAEEPLNAFQLLESQRMALFMFTSCGWFFDDVSGIEPAQVLKYAARAWDLVRPWADADLEKGLMEYLKQARSNDPVYGDGAGVYRVFVEGSRVDPSRAAFHHALSLLACEEDCEEHPFSEMVRPLKHVKMPGNGYQAVIGEAKVSEPGIGRDYHRTFLALHGRLKDLVGMVGENTGNGDLERLAGELRPALMGGDRKEIEGVFRGIVGNVNCYGFPDVLPDTRRRLINHMAAALDRRVSEAVQKDEALKELIYLLRETGEAVPEIIEEVFRLVVADELFGLMASERETREIDWEGLSRVADQTGPLETKLNKGALRKGAQDLLHRRMERIAADPDPAAMGNVVDFLDLADKIGLKPDLWECQNMFHDLYKDKAFVKNLGRERWTAFMELGNRLGFVLEPNA
jgi:alpha-amylase/alpha-mannosidase (GH57 family)